MPKIVQQVVLTLAEVQEAFSALDIIQVDGEACVDGVELLRAVQRLTGTDGAPHRELAEPQAAGTPELVVPSRADPVPTPETSEVPPASSTTNPMGAATIEGAASILALAPPGNCVGCGQSMSECPCDVYVDSVIRDPMQYARERMASGEGPPPWWPAGGGEIGSALSMHDVATIGLDTRRRPVHMKDPSG